MPNFVRNLSASRKRYVSPLVPPLQSPNFIHTSVLRSSAPSSSPRALAHLSHPAPVDGASPRDRHRRKQTRRRRTPSVLTTAARTRTWVRAGRRMRFTSTIFYVVRRRGWTSSWRRGGKCSTAWSTSGRCSRARSAACATRRTHLGSVGMSLVGSSVEGARFFFHDDVF